VVKKLIAHVSSIFLLPVFEKSVWMVWANSQFDASKFLSFFCFFTGRIFGHTPTRNTSLYVVLTKVVPFGG